jgi:hypothetical protein
VADTPSHAEFLAMIDDAAKMPAGARA